MRNVFLALAALGASATPAEEDASRILFGDAKEGTACFARLYDGAHLRAHPRQLTVEIALSVRKAKGPDMKPAWTFVMSAVLRNGVRAGAYEVQVARIEHIRISDALPDELFLEGADGSVEDHPTKFSLQADGKKVTFYPWKPDWAVAWPASASPRLRKRSASKDEPNANHDNDDLSFLLERENPAICARIAKRAQLDKNHDEY